MDAPLTADADEAADDDDVDDDDDDELLTELAVLRLFRARCPDGRGSTGIDADTDDVAVAGGSATTALAAGAATAETLAAAVATAGCW